MNDIPTLPVYGFAPNLGGLLSLAVTVILPILVGLVTRKSTSSTVQAILLLLFAAVKTILVAWLDAENTSAAFEWVPVVYTTLVSFGIAVAVHFGLWRPTGVADAALRSGVKDHPAVGSRLV